MAEDTDNDGKLTLAELRQALDKAGVVATDTSVASLFRFLDINGDGHVEFSELKVALKALRRSNKPKSVATKLNPTVDRAKRTSPIMWRNGGYLRSGFPSKREIIQLSGPGLKKVVES